ncbi:hypothetical protein E2320_003842, partial [Naja naja]
IKFKRRFWK